MMTSKSAAVLTLLALVASLSLLHAEPFEARTLVEEKARRFECSFDWQRIEKGDGTPVVLPHKEKDGEVEVVYKKLTLDKGFVLHIGKIRATAPDGLENARWTVEFIALTGKGLNSAPIEKRLSSRLVTRVYISFSRILGPNEVGIKSQTLSFDFHPKPEEKYEALSLPNGAIELFNRSYKTGADRNDLTIYFLPANSDKGSAKKKALPTKRPSKPI